MNCYLGDLNTPVEQPLGADVVPVGADVVQQAAAGHQLGDQLDRRRQADPQKTAHVGVVHACHHIGLLGVRHKHTHRHTHTHINMLMHTRTHIQFNSHSITQRHTQREDKRRQTES